MNRVIAIAALLVGLAGSAEARNLTSKLGIGYDATLDGAAGASIRYGASADLTLQFILGFVHQSADDGSARTLAFGARGDYRLAGTEQTLLGLVFGLNLFNEGFSPDEGDGESDTSFSIEGGLRLEHFLSPWFSIHGEVGVAIGSRSGGLVGGQDTTYIIIGLSDVLGQAGFTFWFD